MKDLLLHQRTAEELTRLTSDTPHAIMLTGGDHSGKVHIAKAVAGEILSADPEKHPHFMHIHPEKNTVTIDQIRELQAFVKLRTTGKGRIRRIVLLQDAHFMTAEAQNAILKILEEPPADTVLMLTVRGDTTLRPTIYSRTQNIFIRPITKQQAHSYGGDRHTAAEVDRAFMLSKGNPSLFIALMEGSDQHEMAVAITEAKTLLAASTFERLAKVDALSKDKERTANLFAALKRIAQAALKSTADRQDVKQQTRWHGALKTAYETEALLASTANTKLLLTDAFLSL